MEEKSQALKRVRSKSSPSPVDGIPYSVFKKCSTILSALHNLFNLCWVTSVVPAVWKVAVVKLIDKSSAQSDPSFPANDRPIALTSCVGKLFSTIIRNRLLSCRLSNKYFGWSIQKVFMPKTSGCSEHHLKLATILRDVKSKPYSLAVCWVDLVNTYGSVHHSLIFYSFNNYQVPPKLTNLVKVFYTSLVFSSFYTSLALVYTGVDQCCLMVYSPDSRQAHLLTSPDLCVRLMVERALQKDLSLTRPKFKASLEVREVMTHDPDFSRKSLTTATKVLVTEDDDDQHLRSLHQLEKQGQMSRFSSPEGAKIWAKALEGAKDEYLKFTLNSAVDTLPHNANLFLWEKCVMITVLYVAGGRL